MRSKVVLPQPDGPTMATNSCLAHVEVHVLERQKVSPSRWNRRVHVLEADAAHGASFVQLRRRRRSTCRSATSITTPTTPMAIMPAITIDVATLSCPCTIM